MPKARPQVSFADTLQATRMMLGQPLKILQVLDAVLPTISTDG